MELKVGSITITEKDIMNPKLFEALCILLKIKRDCEKRDKETEKNSKK